MSKDKRTYNILSEKALRKYLKGKLSPKKEHAFERESLNSALEQDALDGWQAHPVDQLADDLDILRVRLAAKRNSSKSFPWLRIAAIGLILLLSGALVWNFSSNIEKQDTLVINQQLEKDGEQEDLENQNTKNELPVFLVESEAEIIEEDQEVQIKKDLPQQTVQKKEVLQQEKQPEPLLKTTKKALNVELNKKSDMEPNVPKPTAIAAKESSLAQEIVADGVKVENEAVLPAARHSTIAGVDIDSQPLSSLSRVASSVPHEKKSGQQIRTISGVVTSSGLGEPLAGVTVLVNGKNRGVVTNSNGRYEIQLAEEDTKLAFSFIGFDQAEAEVGNEDSINIKLNADQLALEEVVVVEYGSEQSDVIKSEREKAQEASTRYEEAEPTEGMRSFKKYLEFSKLYPERARTNNIKGDVKLNVKVAATGEILEVKVLEGLGYGCDEEAIRLVKEGPKWTPATEDGRPVNSQVEIEIKFP